MKQGLISIRMKLAREVLLISKLRRSLERKPKKRIKRHLELWLAIKESILKRKRLKSDSKLTTD